MLSVGLANISGQGAVLDLTLWHVDPSLIHEHLHTTRGHSIKLRVAIPVVAAFECNIGPRSFQRGATNISRCSEGAAGVFYMRPHTDELLV